MELKELDKETLKYLRVYGHTMNNIPEYKNVIEYLKNNFFYEYLFYIDLDVKKEVEKIFENETRNKDFYKSFTRGYRRERKRVIKQWYGLEKKGIL